MSLQFLYFDLGGVLLSFSHDAMCRQMAEVAGVSVATVQDALFDAVAGPSLQWRLERGDVSVDDAYDHFCERTGTTPDRAALYHAASNIFAPLDATIKLATRLRAAGHRMGILSNTNPFDWRFVTDGRFSFINDNFQCHALSFEAHAMKPDPEIFQYAAQQAGLSPGEIFFTDDREENVAGALAAGFDAVVFQSADQLADALRERGVEFA
ncbi:MAG: HAD family phosphatase [Planctomycetales bacterium]|nr:HAD family phosphatase [Planctomycetales bacterium]